jgi:hypothetical protein
LPPPSRPPAGSCPSLTYDLQPIELGFEQCDRTKLRVALKDQPDGCRLGLDDDQFPVLDVIAERHIAAHPHALGL